MGLAPVSQCNLSLSLSPVATHNLGARTDLIPQTPPGGQETYSLLDFAKGIDLVEPISAPHCSAKGRQKPTCQNMVEAEKELAMNFTIYMSLVARAR